MMSHAGARAQRRAVHRGDHRFGAFVDRVEAFARAAIELPVFARCVGVRPLLHVGAGGEHLAGAGQDRHPHVIPIGQRIEHADHLLAERVVLRVHRWPVHDHRGDEILDSQFDSSGHVHAL
jgi:hypothetical protein